MNTTINKLTNPNVRHTIKGIFLCEKLNKHLIWKKNFGSNFYGFYFILMIIKYVLRKRTATNGDATLYNNRLQQTTSKETWGGITAII